MGLLFSQNDRGGRDTNTRDRRNLPSMSRPQTSYMWEVYIVDNTTSSKSVGFYAKNTTIPPASTEPIKANICGAGYVYAGRENSVKTLSITLYDNEKLEIWGFFDYWRQLSNKSINGHKEKPVAYMKNVRIVLKTADDEESMNVEFVDCFPLEVGEMTLSYGTSEELTFDVQLTYHHRTIAMGG